MVKGDANNIDSLCEFLGITRDEYFTCAHNLFKETIAQAQQGKLPGYLTENTLSFSLIKMPVIDRLLDATRALETIKAKNDKEK
jgi:hypothetical protein